MYNRTTDQTGFLSNNNHTHIAARLKLAVIPLHHTENETESFNFGDTEMGVAILK
jgi:hypothetical protein